MRKLLISILLTGAAVSPAVAAQERDNQSRPHWGDREGSRPDRSQAGEERQQQREQARQERSGGDRPQFGPRQQSPDRDARADVAPSNDGNNNERYRQRGDGVSRWTRDNVQQAGETSRWTRDPNQRAGETGRWTRDRTGWTGERTTIRDYGDYRQSRESQRQVTQRSRWTKTSWNRDWRNDRRYDWRRYRDSHRSIFHLGIYVDPFNYGYRPFNIGYRLRPLYYTQDYWFDPGMYGLPYPPPGTRWVRYWNDALLVDIYTGEVVDVIQGFFW
jgi:Ni/Co efflux regulator RcnB